MRIDNTEMDVVRRHSKRIYSYIKRRVFFFFNDTATTEIYTLSLHDALPISANRLRRGHRLPQYRAPGPAGRGGDRKSTRLNSSHSQISYAVFCLKKKRYVGRVVGEGSFRVGYESVVAKANTNSRTRKLMVES